MTSPTVSPSCFIKSFCQAGNPALLHYSYSAIETGELEVPTTTLRTCKAGGKTLCNVYICCHLRFPSCCDHQVEHRNHKLDCTTVWRGASVGVVRFLRVNWSLNLCAWIFCVQKIMHVLNCLVHMHIGKSNFFYVIFTQFSLWYCIYAIHSLKSFIIFIALGFPCTGNKKHSSLLCYKYLSW